MPPLDNYRRWQPMANVSTGFFQELEEEQFEIWPEDLLLSSFINTFQDFSKY